MIIARASRLGIHSELLFSTKRLDAIAALRHLAPQPLSGPTLIALLALVLVLGIWWTLNRDRRTDDRTRAFSRLENRRRFTPLIRASADEALRAHVLSVSAHALANLLRDRPELTQVLERRLTATLLEEFVKLEPSDTSYQTDGRDDKSGS